MNPPEPLFFGPRARPLFGWLHRPAASAAPPLGLVVCNPFGYEAICAHRSLRHFAEAAAAAGVPALRFDYDGTGDSAGDDRDPDRLAAWIASVHDAVDGAAPRTGVERGLPPRRAPRRAAGGSRRHERDDVDGFVAIAPVVAGRAYLRELRALQMSLGLSEPPPDASPAEASKRRSASASPARHGRRCRRSILPRRASSRRGRAGRRSRRSADSRRLGRAPA